MKKIILWTATLSLAFSCASSLANVKDNIVNITVTASNQITNIPTDFGSPRFVLDRPFFIGDLPGFAINSGATTQTLTVDAGFNMPGISITDHVAPNDGLTWYYFCDGLTFNYAKSDESATVTFTGQIEQDRPGTGVTCTCTGSACSTSAPILATLKMMD